MRFIHFFLLSFSFLAGTGTIKGCSGFSYYCGSILILTEFCMGRGLRFREF